MSSDTWKDDKSYRLILDNGSKWMRFGRVDQEMDLQRVMNLIGSSKKNNDQIWFEDLEKIFDESHYKFNKPHVRGVLVNYDVQMNLWSKLFNDQTGEKNMKGYSLTITNQIAAPSRSKEKLLEILFEYYGFANLAIPQ